MFARVQLLTGLDKSLTYEVPENLAEEALPGRRVIVPVIKSQQLGIIVNKFNALPENEQIGRIRRMVACLDDGPVVPEDLLKLCIWASEYYVYPLGLILRAILPERLRMKPRLYYRLEIPEALPEEVRSIFFRRGREGVASREALARAGIKSWTIRRWENRGVLSRIFLLPSTSSPKRLRRVVRILCSPDQVDDRKFHEIMLPLFSSFPGSVDYSTVREKLGNNYRYWIRKWVKKGWIKETEEEDTSVLESIYAQDVPVEGPFELTNHQKTVMEQVLDAAEKGGFSSFLLYGVTGSGKTEVYLRLCERVLARDRGVLVLVPEIALITQMEALFKSRFGNSVALWHSGLEPDVKLDQWRAARDGLKRIVLGVRSAVFTPVRNCGLIIVDEEHDSSYKQDDRFRYNARDVAIMRADILGIPILLGSATPSVQSYFDAKTGKYRLLVLPERIRSGEGGQDDTMPVIEVVDMRREKGGKILSGRLRELMIANYQKGMQTLLFLNRRGFAACALCGRCGHMVECDLCSVAMTYHAGENVLKCHYCGAIKEVPTVCPKCEKSVLVFLGIGTERVEAEVRKLLPGARIERIDRDTVENMEILVKKLNAVRRGEAQVIVGTQMLSKGHDFPGISLTGVIHADLGFGLPDFRAGEITAQQLFQVSGRPGRRKTRGHVIIQTYNPEHYIFKALSSHAYQSFCDLELKSRKILSYPPFVKMARVICTSRDRDEVYRAVHELGSFMRRIAKEGVQILGPAPAPYFRLRGLYRWHILVKSKTGREMSELLRVIAGYDALNLWRRRGVAFAIDRDPMLCL
ncbi:replication restart helicase PriA [Thermodesulforhabdus norvegica]|uniref:Replication restart protein PriA n=1 Tax=Thermodesulforhabdus norvegica TaxID=39841 RepID=A0A1I4W9Y0_9BACT|nr:primosomal protein N' [Thermodesulforhabdus norvegica]SFN10488.1 replication restart DNA helicase PriA [Thermodesulforhabdus norvegica]